MKTHLSTRNPALSTSEYGAEIPKTVLYRLNQGPAQINCRKNILFLDTCQWGEILIVPEMGVEPIQLLLITRF